MIRALAIYPAHHFIYPTYIETWEDIAPRLGFTTFDCVYFDDDVTLYVDDEGLLSGGNVSFNIGERRLFGNAMLLGTNDEGDSIDCPWDLATALTRVSFEEQYITGPDGSATYWQESQTLINLQRKAGSPNV